MSVEHDLQFNPFSPINEREMEETEPTKLELFQEYISENEISDIVTDYIQELEHRIYEKNKVIQNLISEMKSTDKLTYYINQLNKILKL